MPRSWCRRTYLGPTFTPPGHPYVGPCFASIAVVARPTKRAGLPVEMAAAHHVSASSRAASGHGPRCDVQGRCPKRSRSATAAAGVSLVYAVGPRGGRRCAVLPQYTLLLSRATSTHACAASDSDGETASPIASTPVISLIQVVSPRHCRRLTSAASAALRQLRKCAGHSSSHRCLCMSVRRQRRAATSARRRAAHCHEWVAPPSQEFEEFACRGSAQL